MTLADALAWAGDQLGPSPTAHVDARLLLQHVLHCSRAQLIAHGDALLTPDQQAHFEALVGRAARREPVPYLIGSAPFYGRDFAVTPAVLIPRPETELLVEAALQWAQGRAGLVVVDVGAGSGCIAVTLALALPGARIIATDISAEALAVARQNAKTHGVEGRIEFLRGSLLEPAPASPDLVIGNLPYIGEAEWTELEGGVKWYEPELALRGGPTGLELIERLLQEAKVCLRPGAAIFLELGWRQGAAARQLAQKTFPQAQIELLPDYAGHDRVLVVKNNEYPPSASK